MRAPAPAAAMSPAARDPVRTPRLWFGLTAAPLAWTIAELVGYGMVSRDCTRGSSGLAVYAVPQSPVVMVILAIAMAALAGGGLLVALRSIRRVEAAPAGSDVAAHVEAGVEAPEPHGPAVRWARSHFMAHAGVLVSGLLLANIVLFAIMPLFLSPCSGAR